MFKDLIAKIQFWYVKNFIKIDKHYRIMIDMANTDAMSVQLLGKYDGVIVEYANLKISDEGLLCYNIDVIANPNLKNVDSNAFWRFTCNVIRSIITNSIEMVKDKHEDGKFDTVKSNDERSLHEENSAVLEERVPDRKPRKKAVRGNKSIRPKI